MTNTMSMYGSPLNPEMQRKGGAPEVSGQARAERDPTGLNPHAPGAKLDAGKQRPGLVLGAFANALRAVTRIGTYGAQKYSDNGWLSVPDGQRRYSDAMMRHWLAMQAGEETDAESGEMHMAHFAWNALAVLELELRKRKSLYVLPTSKALGSELQGYAFQAQNPLKPEVR